MDLKIAGKTAYISGGAHGIGAAITARLSDEGVRVAVSDYDGAALEANAGSWKSAGNPILVEADLSTATGVDSALSEVERGLGAVPDIVVNNVGMCISRDLLDIDDAAWDLTFQLNFMSYVRTIRAFGPRMAARGNTSIINIASDLAKQPDDVPADYGAMKSAVLYLTKAASKKFAPATRVNAVLPGPVWTGLWSRPGGIADKLAELYDTDRETAVDRYLEDRQLTLGIADPDDVATIVAYLASPLAKRISGSAYDVGGTIQGLY
ncbi:SDR family NAD(P)-dependent oxidoreductase [Nocardia carnea]|uniref:SDR family NAD(P)-dependent oxidoreductase n=1 Tax=Nocardia carnea TaxID=37328 RepID=UPI002453F286|nr:SDR family oxidoreductase [Nocardia carnea]